jgi:hypothetical protein
MLLLQVVQRVPLGLPPGPVRLVASEGAETTRRPFASLHGMLKVTLCVLVMLHVNAAGGAAGASGPGPKACAARGL